ncbi:MAG: DNA replication/repair protein RecF [Gammaproteobacteria bacterium]
MPLELLECTHIRNLSTQCITLSPGLNHFYGDNGAGKTSILESIYILGTGKSFRASQLTSIVANGQKICQIGGRINGGEDGFSGTLKCIKSAQEKPQYLISDQPASSVAELAQVLPVQVLNIHGYQLLADPPEERRRWLDWMMFHVEPSFYSLWREYHRVLKQRNAALRYSSGTRSDLPQWTALLATVGAKLHEARAAVMSLCFPAFRVALEGLPGVSELSLDYHPGWDNTVLLDEVLSASYERDMSLGYTHAGPHRADLKIKINEKSASQVLSTGQQKTFVTGLQLAQVCWMIEQTGKRPILLIDDLPSELDSTARALLGERLSTLDAQICLTSVDKSAFLELSGDKPRAMFHVERGVVHSV